jgi:hypothetical protein
VKLRDKPLIDDLESDLYEEERRRFKEMKERKEKEEKEDDSNKNNSNNNNTNTNINNDNSNSNNNNTTTSSATADNVNNSKSKPKPKAGRVYVKKRYVVTVRKVSDDKNDRRLQCMHCNTIYADTYMLMKHIKELAGVDDVSDVEIEEVGVGSSLLDYVGDGN